tara:strand:- start:869 stop:1444 length:576 start_codon:yes stop_codon:yes gene_type:complete
MRRVIGLTGRKGCGKSSVGAILAHNYDFHVRSFASPIKEMLVAMGIPKNYIYDRDYKEKPVPGFGKSARYMMQALGTEFGRHLVHPDVWIRALKNKLDDLTGDVVIDDVRFENEARMIHAYGGMILRIERPHTEDRDTHISELQLDSSHVDQTLQNISPYTTDLELAVTEFMETKYNGTFHTAEPVGIVSQ